MSNIRPLTLKEKENAIRLLGATAIIASLAAILMQTRIEPAILTTIAVLSALLISTVQARPVKEEDED